MAGEMKYGMIEMPDHSHRLTRYGEIVKRDGGLPNNAELEFWQRIRELEAERDELQRRLDHAEKTADT